MAVNVQRMGLTASAKSGLNFSMLLSSFCSRAGFRALFSSFFRRYAWWKIDLTLNVTYDFKTAGLNSRCSSVIITLQLAVDLALTCLARKYSACFCDRGPLLGVLSFLKQYQDNNRESAVSNHHDVEKLYKLLYFTWLNSMSGGAYFDFFSHTHWEICTIKQLQQI